MPTGGLRGTFVQYICVFHDIVDFRFRVTITVTVAFMVTVTVTFAFFMI